MRFQLDPRAKPPERPAPPAPPAAPATTSSAAAPGASPTAYPANAPAPPTAATAAPAAPARLAGAAAAPNRTRLYVLGGLALLLLAGTAGALYFFEQPPFEYPRRYLLEGRELPDRMQMADVPADIRRELGIEENPGQVQEDDLDTFALGGFAPKPADAWAEVLTPSVDYEPILVVALKFDTEDRARNWVNVASNRCGSMANAILRDGDVVVAVAARGGDVSHAWAKRVADRIMAEAPDLVDACDR